MPIAVFVMGAAGAGKSTIGRSLADALDWPFFDGDDFHPPANVAMMAAGIPLTDADREPWLAAMNYFTREHVGRGRSVVLACSALRRAYRDRLRLGLPTARFVYLRADAAILRQRLEQRPGHFMKSEMLASQLATLEEPVRALTIDADRPVDEIVSEVVSWLEKSRV